MTDKVIHPPRLFDVDACETKQPSRPRAWGVAPYDPLRSVGSVAAVEGDEGAAHMRRMLDLPVHGLRYGADAASVPQS